MSQVRTSYDLWRQVARRTGAVVLLIAHHRKLGGDDGDQIAGSHQGLATVDGVLELRKGGARWEKDERRLEIFFRDLPDMDDLIIALNPDILVFESRGSLEERREQARQHKDAQIAEKAAQDAQELADAVQVGAELESRLREEVLYGAPIGSRRP